MFILIFLVDLFDSIIFNTLHRLPTDETVSKTIWRQFVPPFCIFLSTLIAGLVDVSVLAPGENIWQH